MNEFENKFFAQKVVMFQYCCHVHVTNTIFIIDDRWKGHRLATMHHEYKDTWVFVIGEELSCK